MRTTLDLPDPVFRDLKVKAAQDGVSLKDLVRSFVEKCLYEPQALKVKPVRSPLPPPRVSEGPPIRAFTNAEIEEMLLQEDLEHWGYLPKKAAPDEA